MRSQSRIAWSVPSSPVPPCSALNTASWRASRSASARRSSKSSCTVGYISSSNAATTPAPVCRLISRSAESPPITTAILGRVIVVVRLPSEKMYFQFQFHPVLGLDRLAHALDQRQHVCIRRAAAVDDEVRVLVRHLCAAPMPALAPGRLDEPGGVVAWRVAENAAGVRQLERLRGSALGD